MRDASWSKTIQIIGRKTLTQLANYKKELVAQTQSVARLIPSSDHGY